MLLNRNTPFIIGFSGRKQSGKNTCAEFLTSYVQKKNPTLYTQSGSRLIKTYAFADPMKRVCMQYFGLSYEQCYGTNEEKNSPTLVKWRDFPVTEVAEGRGGYMTAREVLQFFGTEVIRKMLNNAHVNALMWDIAQDSPLVALVTDVRFINEVEAVQNTGGKVIRLTRVRFMEDKHESETALDPENFDWTKFDNILDNRELTVWEQEVILETLAKKWGLVSASTTE